MSIGHFKQELDNGYHLALTNVAMPNGNPKIYTFDIENGFQELIDFNGLTVAPSGASYVAPRGYNACFGF